MEALSTDRSLKCALEQEALVKVGILDFDATVDCKFQDNNSKSILI